MKESTSTTTMASTLSPMRERHQCPSRTGPQTLPDRRSTGRRSERGARTASSSFGTPSQCLANGRRVPLCPLRYSCVASSPALAITGCGRNQTSRTTSRRMCPRTVHSDGVNVRRVAIEQASDDLVRGSQRGFLAMTNDSPSIPSRKPWPRPCRFSAPPSARRCRMNEVAICSTRTTLTI